MKKLLIDFSAIKSGGGAQLASSFLSMFSTLKFVDNFEVHILLPSAGPLKLQKYNFLNFKMIESPNNIVKRFFFEYLDLQCYLKRESIDIIFTFFGAGLPHGKHVYAVTSTAYPIICYPESRYWDQVSFREKFKKLIWNYVRCKRLSNANLVIVETEIMKNRIEEKIGLSNDMVYVIPPSVSTYVSSVKKDVSIIPSKFLILSNNAFHKNIRLLIPVIEELYARGIEDIEIYISIDKNDFLNSIDCVVDEALLGKYVIFLGAIPPEEIGRYYVKCDCLINISDLESFSNNYMESWKTETLLIVSDRDFSRMICGDSAVYVDPYNPNSIVDAIMKIRDDVCLRGGMIKAGIDKLNSLPSLSQRTEMIVNKLLHICK